METIDSAQVDIGNDIAVDDDKGFIIPYIRKIFDRAAGPKNLGFMARNYQRGISVF